MKRLWLGLLVLALLAAHVVYWYLPRERAVAPRLAAAMAAAARSAASPQGGRAVAAGEPLEVLAAGRYDLCLWVPYPHQNLGVLAGAVDDLPGVIAAAVRLSRGAGGAQDEDAGAAGAAAKEPQDLPTFGPFEVPPASELVACADLAGGRLRVVARIYPALAAVARLAGRLAGNPWLAGGEAGRMRIAWDGRLWTVIAGEESPPPAVAAGSAAARDDSTPPRPGGAAPGTNPEPPAVTGPEPPGGPTPVPDQASVPAQGVRAEAAGDSAPELHECLALVRWRGARPEIPAGYYELTRKGPDLVLSLAGSRTTAGSPAAATLPPAAATGATPRPAAGGRDALTAPLPPLLVAVGPDWQGGGPPGFSRPAAPHGGPAGGTPQGTSAPAAGAAALPPAALAMFEAGSSRLSSLGDLPGLAVFNAAGAVGAERWSLPTAGVLRLLTGRLPAIDLDGWHIVALDPGSLRQAEALAPRLAALFQPGPGALPRLSLGLWIDPRSSLRVVTRIRRFVEKFPLASRRQAELWRDWETVLDPFANCAHATLTATASPPSMRLVLVGCTASGPR